MIIPDINLLLYTYDAGSPFHAKAAAWWQRCLCGPEPVGLLPVVLFGFVRLGTNRQVFQHPMTPAEAAGHVRAWLEQPPVELLCPGSGHVERVLRLLEDAGTAASLITEAQIAAMAIEHEAVVHTTDTDFLRFAELRWYNPMTEMGSPRRGRPSGAGR